MTIKRDDEFLDQFKARPKASRRPSDRSTVAVYEIMPSSCMRKAFYLQQPDLPEPANFAAPLIRGKAIGIITSYDLIERAGK